MRTLLTLVLGALIVAAPAGAREIDAPSLLEEINVRRAQHQLPPLRLHEALVRAADERMRHMIDLGYWAHESPDGTSPFFWLRATGYRYSAAGENLARGFETVEVLVDSWMESPGHRSTLLSPSYADVGFSVLEGSTTGRGIGRSVVAMFGRLPDAPPVEQQQASTDRSSGQ